MHLHPSGHAPIIALVKVDMILRRRLADTLPAAGIPDGRIGHPQYAFALEPRVCIFDLAYLGKLLVRRPLHALVWRTGTAVQLHDAVGHTVIVDGPPCAGKRLCVAEVVAAIDLPLLRNVKRLDHMGKASVAVVLRIVDKFLEELARINIPAPVQIHLAQPLRQRQQILVVFRLAFHQRRVIRHLCLNKAVVFRLFLFLKVPVDK